MKTLIKVVLWYQIIRELVKCFLIGYEFSFGFDIYALIGRIIGSIISLITIYILLKFYNLIKNSVE